MRLSLQVGEGGAWFGLIDGDKYKDGTHHFFRHEAAFVRLKHHVLKYDVLQLLLVCFTALLLKAFSTSGQVLSWLGNLPYIRTLRDSEKSGAGTCRLGDAGAAFRSAA